MGASKWPVISGDYSLGKNPNNPVVIITLASNIELNPEKFSLSGPMKTENLGIERIITNVIANPHIRFLILCGEESKGHFSGQTLLALVRNGIDENKRIVGSKGAFPYIENVPKEGIERFRNQVKIIDLIGVKDVKIIEKKADELIARDPGSFGEPLLFFEFVEEKEEIGVRKEESLALGSGVFYDYLSNKVYGEE